MTQHKGVVMTGDDGPDGVKAFYIHIDARPDEVAEVRRMLADILGHVDILAAPAHVQKVDVLLSKQVFTA